MMDGVLPRSWSLTSQDGTETRHTDVAGAQQMAQAQVTPNTLIFWRQTAPNHYTGDVDNKPSFFIDRVHG